MKTQKDIETMLESTTPKLRQDEAQVLWQRIEAKISEPAIPSPFFNMFTVGRMSVAALALVLIVGVGGTTVAAEQARPGDVLFPVERALEEVRLALAVNDNSRASLQLEFAEKRLAELRSLIEETSNDDFVPTVTHHSSSTVRFYGEADVFTDITIVTVEINDRKTSFRTEARSREEIVKEIVNHYNLTESVVEAGLDFEIEDRASRVSDIKNTSNDDERIDESIKLLSSLVDDENEEERKRFVNEVLDTLDFDQDSRVDIRDDEGDKRIEIRDGDERIRIREKDGEVRVDIKSDDKDDEDDSWQDDSDNDHIGDRDRDEDTDNDDDNDRENNNDNIDRDDSSDDSDDDGDRDGDNNWNDGSDSNTSGDDNDSEEVNEIESIEVRVEEGIAEVEISYDDSDDEFTLPYISRATLVTALSVKTGLNESDIEGVLELEIKD